ncbi:PAAR domain-containing protein [Phaeodactylibacter xiamenensis]|uniref:PAAR domain-containing protein n=1 Tax=Phaeodactylibacter xiamenensis TaxID=1524460 RepID=UPI0024A99153|nr:PAAR domain-containing protein [Phaeodactylibacter xiamenensis]
MSKPAARIGDSHTCPMVDGKKPHVGGAIMHPGSTSVLIGGKPAATVGHKCICAGPTDVIITGSKSVKIEGKYAARIGDMTAHGGKIVAGEASVLIGDNNGIVLEEKLERYQKRLDTIKLSKEKATAPNLSEEQRLTIRNAADRLERNNKAVERAKLANHIYSLPFDNEEKEAQPPPDGWKIAESYKDPTSGFVYAVYESEFETPSKPVLVFRGTDNKDAVVNDWVFTNILQAFGFRTKQYRESAAFTANLLEKRPNGFDISGHSKAGGQAALAALVSGQDAYTFNAAGVHQESKLVEGITPTEDSEDKIQAYHFKYDPLNWLQDMKILPLLRGVTNVVAKLELPYPASNWVQKFVNEAAPSASGNRIELAPAEEEEKEISLFAKMLAFTRKRLSYNNPWSALTELKDILTKTLKFHDIDPYIIDSIEAEKDADKTLLEATLNHETV